MEAGEVGMRILEVELHRAGRLRPTAPDFREQVLKTMRQVDANPMGLSRYRIDNRFPTAFDQARDADLRLPLIDIHLKLDPGEHRIVDLLIRGGKHLEEGGTRIGILTAHDTKESISLFLRGALIDDRNDAAAPHVNRARPRDGGRNSQPIQPSLAMLSFLDLYGHYRFALPVCGKPIELTRAAIGAITMKKLASLDGPLHITHALSP